MKKTVFITGATGNIGSRLIVDFLENDRDCSLILLIRAADKDEAASRLRGIIDRQRTGIDWDMASRRIKIICGDITADNLGLTDEGYRSTITATTHIIHAAAATKFVISERRATDVNIEGTLRVIEFARRISSTGRLQRFVHISTAYVCGSRNGIIYENDELDMAGYANNYEKSKAEAERMVQSFIHELPIAIVRPSIVVGDSQTGRLADYNVLYTPLKMILKGKVKYIPGRAKIRLDIVPVDYVCRSIRAILFDTDTKAGSVFHLTAGFRNSLNAGRIVDYALEAGRQVSGFDQKVRFLNSRLIDLIRKYVSRSMNRRLKMFDIYFPYLQVEHNFDDTNTRRVLDKHKIVLPKFADFIPTIIGTYLKTLNGNIARAAA